MILIIFGPSVVRDVNGWTFQLLQNLCEMQLKIVLCLHFFCNYLLDCTAVCHWSRDNSPSWTLLTFQLGLNFFRIGADFCLFTYNFIPFPIDVCSLLFHLDMASRNHQHIWSVILNPRIFIPFCEIWHLFKDNYWIFLWLMLFKNLELFLQSLC